MAEKKPTNAHPPKRRQHRRQHRRLTETHRDSPRLHRDSAEGCHRDSPRLTETHRDSPRLFGTLSMGFPFFVVVFGAGRNFFHIYQRFWPYLSLFGSFGCEFPMLLSFEAVISAEISGTMVFLFLPCTFRDILARIRQQSQHFSAVSLTSVGFWDCLL